MKYVKKPVVIDALRWTGKNLEEVEQFAGMNLYLNTVGEIRIGTIEAQTAEHLTVRGVMTARIGDWIIRGIAGEFYPCKSDIFDASYSPSVEVK